MPPHYYIGGGDHGPEGGDWEHPEDGEEISG